MTSSTPTPGPSVPSDAAMEAARVVMERWRWGFNLDDAVRERRALENGDHVALRESFARALDAFAADATRGERDRCLHLAKHSPACKRCKRNLANAIRSAPTTGETRDRPRESCWFIENTAGLWLAANGGEHTRDPVAAMRFPTQAKADEEIHRIAYLDNNPRPYETFRYYRATEHVFFGDTEVAAAQPAPARPAGTSEPVCVRCGQPVTLFQSQLPDEAHPGCVRHKNCPLAVPVPPAPAPSATGGDARCPRCGSINYALAPKCPVKGHEDWHRCCDPWHQDRPIVPSACPSCDGGSRDHRETHPICRDAWHDALKPTPGGEATREPGAWAVYAHHSGSERRLFWTEALARGVAAKWNAEFAPSESPYRVVPLYALYARGGKA